MNKAAARFYRNVMASTMLPLSVIAVLLTASGTLADTDFPSHTITVICSSAAGGTSDLISRALAAPLSELLHQSVIVENMPGANGTPATEHVARAAADGYTLLSAVDSNMSVNPILYSVTYDPFRDFVPIAPLVRVTLVLIVSPSGPNSIRELIAEAKAKPGKLNYASVGYGSDHHLGTEEFDIRNSINMVHIPFRGQAAAITALLGGQVDLEFASIGVVAPLLAAGKVKALAIGSKTRSTMLPQVPTMTEAGVSGFELGGWYGLLAPAKTPPEVVKLLSDAVAKAKTDPRFVTAMQAESLEIIDPSEDLTSIMHADMEKWKRVIEVTGTKAVQ
jgi:tripartite-type tricarboxylate transporter receptor subunit TctC